ncbi:30S ribosomal protein S2 [Candidatus Margulisiibacteriota bacterium]
MNKKQENKQIEEKVVTMRELLEAGVHFGHQTKRWDPRMKKYIYTSRNDIHVIDLQQSLALINETYEFVRDTVKKGGRVLFVGTKKQAQEAIAEESKRCGMYYVNKRWLGGMLTNLETIRKSVKRLKELEEMETNGEFELRPTKEASRLKKELGKLKYYLDGVSEMKRVPQIVIIIDTLREEITVKEARKLKIPIVGVVDTNCNPQLISHPIPANDDAIRSIKLLVKVFANAVLEGKGETIEQAGEELSFEDEMQEAVRRVEKEEEISAKEGIKQEK